MVLPTNLPPCFETHLLLDSTQDHATWNVNRRIVDPIILDVMCLGRTHHHYERFCVEVSTFAILWQGEQFNRMPRGCSKLAPLAFHRTRINVL